MSCRENRFADRFQVEVRILRITYGPGEKSPMHSHPDGVQVFLTDAHAKFTYPDGKTEEINGKAGQAMYHPAFSHQPESLSDKSFELILVELKGKPAAKK